MTLESLLLLALGSILPSFSVAWLVTYWMRRLAPRWGLVDSPNTRKVHTSPVPLGGGLGIVLGVVVPFALGQLILLFVDLQHSGAQFVDLLEHVDGLRLRASSLWVLLGGAGLLAGMGLYDDWRGLAWKVRLMMQVVVAAFCVVTQGWRLTAFMELPYLSWTVSVVLSVVWIVALVNSFNMLDNMDGLAAGIATIAASLLAVVMLVVPDPVTRQPQLFVGGFLLVLIGALVGFLWHNRPPAKIFMGDAGSYFIGFSLAVATLLATYAGVQSAAPYAILAPVCVMAVPLYDMVTVLWIRLRAGRSPFAADKNHFSHRLVELGLSKRQAVLTIYLTTGTCGLGALLLHQVNWWGAVVIVLIVVCMLLLIAILETTARRKLNE